MNRILIDVLNAMNSLLALAIVFLGGMAGYLGFPGIQRPLGAVLGLVGGIAVAAIICGLLAIFIEIEKHLRRLAPAQLGDRAQAAQRIEPAMSLEEKGRILFEANL